MATVLEATYYKVTRSPQMCVNKHLQLSKMFRKSHVSITALGGILLETLAAAWIHHCTPMHIMGDPLGTVWMAAPSSVS